MKIDIGINEQSRVKLAGELSRFLANSYILYLKTHNFHWNVKGPMFQTLHLMFEEHYNDLAIAVDEIAERIRALGEPAPGTYEEYMELGTIKETKGVPKAEEMISLLVEGHEEVVKMARNVISVADEAGDESTADLVTGRMKTHEKTAWMLRSLLES